MSKNPSTSNPPLAITPPPPPILPLLVVTCTHTPHLSGLLSSSNFRKLCSKASSTLLIVATFVIPSSNDHPTRYTFQSYSFLLRWKKCQVLGAASRFGERQILSGQILLPFDLTICVRVRVHVQKHGKFLVKFYCHLSLVVRVQVHVCVHIRYTWQILLPLVPHCT